MAHPGEDHRNFCFIAGIDRFLVAHGATWLDDCGDTSFGCSIDGVRERKKRIGAEDCALGFRSGILDGDARRGDRSPIQRQRTSPTLTKRGRLILPPPRLSRTMTAMLSDTIGPRIQRMLPASSSRWPFAFTRKYSRILKIPGKS